MRSTARILGHPIHPMLIVFPIGFWVGSFAADVLYLMQGDDLWFRISRIAMLGGLLGAGAAAVPGLVDYFGSVPPHSEGKKTARLHGILNGSAILLYALNLWWRGRPETAEGGAFWLALALSAVGVGLIGVSGWLGGELVYRWRIGIEGVQVEGQPTLYGSGHGANPGSFVEVAREDELGVGQMKHVVVNGAWIVITRTGSGWYAVDELCTHEGGPLCDGVLMEHVVQCPWHGSRFDVRSGEVLAGPAKRGLQTHAVRVEDGRVRVAAPKGSASAAKTVEG